MGCLVDAVICLNPLCSAAQAKACGYGPNPVARACAMVRRLKPAATLLTRWRSRFARWNAGFSLRLRCYLGGRRRLRHAAQAKACGYGVCLVVTAFGRLPLARSVLFGLLHDLFPPPQDLPHRHETGGLDRRALASPPQHKTGDGQTGAGEQRPQVAAVRREGDQEHNEDDQSDQREGCTEAEPHGCGPAPACLPDQGVDLLMQIEWKVVTAAGVLSGRARSLPPAEGLEPGPGAGGSAMRPVGIGHPGLDLVEEPGR